MGPLVIVLPLVVRLVVLAVVLVLAGWTYRRVRLRSLPWLGVYLLLATPLSNLASLVVLRGLEDGHARASIPFGQTSAEFLAIWNAANDMLQSVMYLLLTVLIFSDVIFLLMRVGMTPEWKPIQLVLRARQYAPVLGMVLLGLLVVPVLTALGL